MSRSSNRFHLFSRSGPRPGSSCVHWVARWQAWTRGHFRRFASPLRCAGVWPGTDRWAVAWIELTSPGEWRVLERWDVPLPEPLNWTDLLPESDDSVSGEDPFFDAHAHLDEDRGQALRLALRSLRQALPKEVDRLVLAWPDQALWQALVSLPGPVDEEHWRHQVSLDISHRIPWPLHASAWGCQRQAGATSTDAALPLQAQCWAVPRASVLTLQAYCKAEGFALQCVAPGFVVTEEVSRSALTPGHNQSAALSANELAVATARRAWESGPDLLAPRSCRWQQMGLRGLRSWLAPTMTAVLAGWSGLYWGQTLAAEWQQEQTQWTQRGQALQAQIRQHQALQAQRKRWQAEVLQLEQQRDDNLRFVQVLQSLSSTATQGLQWQRCLVRPRQIELRGVASDASVLNRWLARWSSEMPAGGNQQLQWQPNTLTTSGGQSWPVLGIELQLAWQAQEGGQ
jgi:hypothetical protein